MKALSINQPWAWAIIAGHKRYENRTWTTAYRGPLLIHAGKSLRYKACFGSLLGGITMPNYDELLMGGFIGTVDLVDIIPVSEVQGQRFAEGPWCWVLENPKPIPFEPAAGQLSLWVPSR